MHRRRCISISAAALVGAVLGVRAAQDPAALFQSARELLGAGERAEAVKRLDELSGLPALTPVARFQIGWLYGQAREYPRALEVFQSLPENVPDPLTHGYAVALTYFNMSRYDRTVQVLAELKERGYTDAKSANLLGVAYAKAGEARKAYDALREGVLASPSDQDGYLNLITLCVDNNDLRLAGTIADRGVEAFPKSARLRVRRGAVDLILGQVEGARQNFREALERSPKDQEAYFFLALCDYQEGKFADAVQVLQKPVDEGFADSDVHYLMAECLMRSSASATAAVRKQLDRALALDATSVPARTLRAKLALEAGKPQEAAADLEKARTVEPDSRPVLYNLGRAYRMMGRQQEALALFQKVQQDSQATAADMGKKRLGKDREGTSQP